VRAKGQELIALLSLDQPANGLIPAPAKVKLLESFGDSLGLMIEKNHLFTEVAQLSRTDEMTGLHNYRFMREKVHALIEDGVSPIAFVFIDLNNFKAYNDRYGHLSGDEVLRNFSRLLHRAVKNLGFAARYGGDEFILILPGAGRRTAETVVARLKRLAAADPIAVPVGFCHGLSTYPRDGTDFGALIDHADRWLYRRKERT
jgi:diguanylate cyclase (GGDEF)-like protein